MTIICSIVNGYFAGGVREIADTEGCPPGWFRVSEAPVVPEGLVAKYTANGWVYEEPEVITPPPPPVVVPFKISKLQAELFLYYTGMLDTVQDAIAAKKAAGDVGYDIYWRSASHFERNHLALAAIAFELGWSDQMLDTLFIEASKIV